MEEERGARTAVAQKTNDDDDVDECNDDESGGGGGARASQELPTKEEKTTPKTCCAGPALRKKDGPQKFGQEVETAHTRQSRQHFELDAGEEEAPATVFFFCLSVQGYTLQSQ
jgi:hypothetical protein